MSGHPSTPKGDAARVGRWVVEFAPSAGREIRGLSLEDPNFTPTLLKIVEALQCDPLQFPKKRGKLKSARAAALRFYGVSWRLVFIVGTKERRVRVLAIGPHDVAYERAERRI
jgi:mRNA-degrading endonuclease RelE of RelBE toxin-antitoxin system